MTRPTLEQMVERITYEARTGMGQVVLARSAKHLLRFHHNRIRREVVKYIRERGHEYMRDASKKELKQLAAINAGRGWAIKDLADDIATLLDRLAGTGRRRG